MNLHTVVALTLCIGALSACTGTGGSLDYGFENAFTLAGACDDVLVWASDADANVALVLEEPSLVSDAVEADTVTSYELAAADVERLEVLTGNNLTDDLCGSSARVAIDEVYEAVGGSLSVTVTPTDTLPLIDVQFRDVAVRDTATAEVIVLGTLSLQALPVQDGA